MPYTKNELEQHLSKLIAGVAQTNGPLPVPALLTRILDQISIELGLKLNSEELKNYLSTGLDVPVHLWKLKTEIPQLIDYEVEVEMIARLKINK